jgi:hypothetical protein
MVNLLTMLFLAPALAAPCLAPCRLPPIKPETVILEENQNPEMLVVKFQEGSGVRYKNGHWSHSILEPQTKDAIISPYFAHPPAPIDSLADLSLYYRIYSPNALEIANKLLKNPLVEDVRFASLPIPPPADIPPTTEDFRPLQVWLDPLPGLGFTEAAAWPGGTGEYITVADLEYSWEPEHEDLEATLGIETWGFNSNNYKYHGNSVLGQLAGGVNGYGIDGAIPDATLVVIHPFVEHRAYDVASGVLAALDLLVAGDVLLIEQQSYLFGNYCPVSAEPAIFDAITYVVAAGIIVVEPGGNGSQDLDAPYWNGWFDRSLRDSGSIMVGGGASPFSGMAPLSRYSPGGSSYGSRLDVQAWYDSIVTATSGEYDGYLADLYYPDEDGLQAYTESFGGTSGASPMVTAIAGIMQSVAIAQGQPPWTPVELRAELASLGSLQADPENGWIGPQPDLRRLLRSVGR